MTSPAGKNRGRPLHKSIQPQLRNGSGGFVRSRGRRRGQYYYTVSSCNDRVLKVDEAEPRCAKSNGGTFKMKYFFHVTFLKHLMA